jgi:YbbR domain-containing protein
LNLRYLLERATHNWPVKVLSVALAILLFLFYRISTLEERFFSVPLEVRVDNDYIPASTYPRNARVTVRGGRDAVFNILEEDITVFADFTSYRREGIFRAPVEYHKQGSILSVDYLEISVEPVELRLELEEKVSKLVDIIPDIVGYPARGFELGQFYLSPQSMNVVGPRSSLENLRTMVTEAIDLSNLRQSVTLQVGIDSPDPLIRFPEGGTVEFRGIIQETKLIRNFNEVDLILMDLDSRYTISSDLPRGEIKVQGSQILLDEIGIEDFSLLIDCSVIRSPGVYRLPVEVEGPREILILQYEPEEIVITVEEIVQE